MASVTAEHFFSFSINCSRLELLIYKKTSQWTEGYRNTGSTTCEGEFTFDKVSF